MNLILILLLIILLSKSNQIINKYINFNLHYVKSKKDKNITINVTINETKIIFETEDFENIILDGNINFYYQEKKNIYSYKCNRIELNIPSNFLYWNSQRTLFDYIIYCNIIEKINTLNKDEEILSINNNLYLILPVVYINNFNNNDSSDFLYHLSKQKNINKKFSYVIQNNEFFFDKYFFNLDKNNPVIEFYISNYLNDITFITFNRFISVGEEIKNFIYKNIVEKYNINSSLFINYSLENYENVVYRNFYINYEYDSLLENLQNTKIEISGNFLYYNLIINIITILFYIL
jgi:hypothetical protein